MAPGSSSDGANMEDWTAMRWMSGAMEGWRLQERTWTRREAERYAEHGAWYEAGYGWTEDESEEDLEADDDGEEMQTRSIRRWKCLRSDPARTPLVPHGTGGSGRTGGIHCKAGLIEDGESAIGNGTITTTSYLKPAAATAAVIRVGTE